MLTVEGQRRCLGCADGNGDDAAVGDDDDAQRRRLFHTAEDRGAPSATERRVPGG